MRVPTLATITGALGTTCGQIRLGHSNGWSWIRFELLKKIFLLIDLRPHFNQRTQSSAPKPDSTSVTVQRPSARTVATFKSLKADVYKLYKHASWRGVRGVSVNDWQEPNPNTKKTHTLWARRQVSKLGWVFFPPLLHNILVLRPFFKNHFYIIFHIIRASKNWKKKYWRLNL